MSTLSEVPRGLRALLVATLLFAGLCGCGSDSGQPAASPDRAARLYVGDANNDGTMDGSDATKILRIDAGMDTYPAPITAYDANKDGVVDGSDATKILRWDAGIETWPMEVVGGGTNQPPTVNAGSDRIGLVGQAIPLGGTATDDGLPAGSALTVTWTKVSGPGEVSFGNANAASTTATCGVVGTYVLRLTAADGALTASDDVTVTIEASGDFNVIVS